MKTDKLKSTHSYAMGFYILDGKNPVRCNKPLRWSWCFQNRDRHIGHRIVNDMWVSTVFLGVNHNYFDSGSPLLFETMIFRKGERSNFQARYATWHEAEKGHYDTIAACRDPEFVKEIFLGTT